MESWKSELYHAVPIGSIPEEDRKYGIPEQKKFPMPDKQHVISAIKFFNYVTPKYEKQLAKAILARMKEYGMSFEDIGVGEDNRFSKYIPKKDQELAHHGILGMKWGVRRFQNKDGSLTAEGKKHRSETEDSYNRVKFVNGEQEKPTSYDIKKENDKTVKNISQKLLSQKDYYSNRGKEAAITGLNALNKLGRTEYSDDELMDKDNWEWFLFEDQTIGLPQIADLANKGLSSNDIKALVSVGVYSFRRSNYWPYGANESDSNDHFVPDGLWALNELGVSNSSDFIDACVEYKRDNKELKHHGILGQKWGVRRYQNPDGSLTTAGLKRRAQQIDKSNAKFLKKYGDTINKKVEKAVEPYMKIYAERELNTSVRKLKKNGKDSRKYINAYNKKLANLMNTAVGEIKNPNTDYVVQFIAKRGEYGVHTALAAPGTDMSRYGQGVYGNGRIAYRKEGVKTV